MFMPLEVPIRESTHRQPSAAVTALPRLIPAISQKYTDVAGTPAMCGAATAAAHPEEASIEP